MMMSRALSRVGRVEVGRRAGPAARPPTSGIGQRPDDRQGVDALDQVVAGGLAQLLVGADQVEDVVADLEGHAEGLPEGGQRLDSGPARPPRQARRSGTTWP